MNALKKLRVLGGEGVHAASVENTTARPQGTKKLKKINNQNRLVGCGRKNSAGRQDSGNIFWLAGFRKYIRLAEGIRKMIFGRNFRSRAQIKVQVMTINSVQEPSKSELSSGTFGHVKVHYKLYNVATSFMLSFCAVVFC